jgi:hypothetical protein
MAKPTVSQQRGRDETHAREARIAELKAELARLTATATREDAGRHRRSNRLTVHRIETIARQAFKGFWADGGNLYLDAKSPPGINWVFRFKRDGKAHDMGLGPWPLIGLAEAREQALDYRRRLRAGIDPLAERPGRPRRRPGRAHQGDDLQAMCRGLHRGVRGEVEERQARGPMAGDAGGACLSGDRRLAGRGDRYCAGDAGPRTDLA